MPIVPPPFCICVAAPNPADGILSLPQNPITCNVPGAKVVFAGTLMWRSYELYCPSGEVSEADASVSPSKTGTTGYAALGSSFNSSLEAATAACIGA